MLFNVEGISIEFPFEPYDVQKAYMGKVIHCLNTGTHGVLESPTGTGKTLSLLCSILAWVTSKKNQIQNCSDTNSKCIDNNKIFSKDDTKNLWQKVPKVIYSSRTHSQLIQAMNELKRTSYSFLKAIVIGSRDQLCINPDVIKETSNSSKIHLCKMHVSAHSCTFYNNLEKQKDNPIFYENNVVDIEDLISLGKKSKVCPYFMSKELKDNADIIFMPYNYLIDPQIRNNQLSQLENSIIVIDEAHNIERVCEEAASAQIMSSDIAIAIQEVTEAMILLERNEKIKQSNDDEEKDFTIEDLAFLKEIILELEKLIDGVEVNIFNGSTYPANFIFELLEKANIHNGNFQSICKLLENLIELLSVSGENNTLFRKGVGLGKLLNLLTVIFENNQQLKDKVLSSFKIHVLKEEVTKKETKNTSDVWISSKENSTKKIGKVINYWCFNPGFGMEQLLNKNIHSIILTSGTLAPLKPFIAELGIPLPTVLENPHIVDKSHVYVKVIPFGPDKEPLNSNFKNRDNPKYIHSLGMTISSFCPIVPGGVLIFFPSYSLLNKCKDSWQASGVWSQINKQKTIFVEPKDKDTFSKAMTDYYEKIRDPASRGACFMAVCRGKVSEGLDFADVNGRAVVITGLPYPPLKDPRVVLKRQYLNLNRKKENELPSGDSWYELEATRAVNQAIGRVIRHKNDFGAILLCDSRFNYSSQKSKLSSWIQSHLNTSQQYNNFGVFVREISNFFKNTRNFNSQTVSREIVCLKPSNISNTNMQETYNKYEEKPSTEKTTLEIQKANAVSKWNADDYMLAAGKSNIETPNVNSFMNILKKDVSTINFNNSNNEKSSLVTIHKRSSSSDILLSSKKKKLEMIVNYSMACSSSQSKSLDSHKTEEDDLVNVPLEGAELLKLIKSSISAERYKIFTEAVLSYKRDGHFESYFQSLIDVFGNPLFVFFLKSMKRFVKSKHKQIFETELNNFLSKRNK